MAKKTPVQLKTELIVSLVSPAIVLGIATACLGMIGGLLFALVGIRASGEFTALRYAEPLGCGYYQAGPCLDSLTRREVQQMGYTNWQQGSCKTISYCNSSAQPYTVEIAGGYNKCKEGTFECGDGCCPNGTECCGGSACCETPETQCKKSFGVSFCAAVQCADGETQCSGDGGSSICCPQGSTCGTVCVQSSPFGCVAEAPLCVTDDKCGAGEIDCSQGKARGGKVCCNGETESCGLIDDKIPYCKANSCPNEGETRCGGAGKFKDVAYCCAADEYCRQDPSGFPRCSKK